MSIILLRHGETEWSLSGQHTGVTDLPLTASGEDKAKLLRGYLDPAAFQLILTSPRQRARRTAELAGFTGAYQPEVEPDLAEWAYGDYEGITTHEIRERFDPDWRIWTGPTPGGESPEQMRDRMDRLIAKLHRAEVEQAILFGHGHALRALVARWIGRPVADGRLFALDTATVSILGHERETPVVVRWNG